MDPLGLILAACAAAVALFAFLAVRLHNRHLLWPALVVVLFMHGCMYAATSFDASFGVTTGTALSLRAQRSNLLRDGKPSHVIRSCSA